MTTLSIPVPAHLEELVNSLVKRGFAANKAEVVRKALVLLAEEEAINAVLRSQQEAKEGKILRGDLREIAKKFRQNARN